MAGVKSLLWIVPIVFAVIAAAVMLRVNMEYVFVIGLVIAGVCSLLFGKE